MRPNPDKLLVEGEEDKRVIPYLIEANGIPWGDRLRSNQRIAIRRTCTPGSPGKIRLGGSYTMR